MDTIQRLGACALAAACLLLPALPLQAAEPGSPLKPGAMAMARVATTYEVPVYKSRVLNVERPVRKVSVGNAEIADVLITSSREVYLLGRSLGSTNVLLWDAGGKLVDSLDVEVVHDLTALKDKLHQVLPGEAISVFSAQGSLVLRGQVSSASAMDTAVNMARSFARKAAQGMTKDRRGAAPGGGNAEEQVINLLTIGGSQQVMLEVKVAEMQRSLVKRLGINLAAIGNRGNWTFGAANLSQINSWVDLNQSGLLASFASGSFALDMVIDAAKENGSAKVLAEPTLTTLTGQQAEFISGGEFPVPVAADDSKVTIEFKEFGVGVKFLPVVLDSGRINLNLNVSVSELSDANSLVVGNGNTTNSEGTAVAVVIPSITKRSAQSTLELSDGQTIAIAGLINENTRDTVSRFPGLGDLPVLGHLFRSQEFISNETELVILVTPHLAAPIDASQVQLPTDNASAPSDAEFYLLGRTKGETPGRSVPVSLGISEGPFGHDLD